MTVDTVFSLFIMAASIAVVLMALSFLLIAIKIFFED